MSFHTFFYRIGRGGRFGRKCIAINLLSNNDARALREIEEYYSMCIEELPANIVEMM